MEALGIATHVTWPRTKCSIEGKDINGNPVDGDYGVKTEDFIADEDAQMLSKRTGKITRGTIYKKTKIQLYPTLKKIKISDGFRSNVKYFKCDWTPRKPDDYLLSKMNPEDTTVFNNRTHACLENEHDRVQNLNPNKNNINKTNMSKTNPILSINLTPEETIDEIEGYREIIKENIEYDSHLLAHPYDQEMVEGIFDLILEAVLSKNGEITIAGDVYPKNLVKSKFLKLNYSHVEYVINCLGKNTTKVRNIKSYLLASLFNAGSTIGSYYRAEVNHDMP